jgi:hypothetical protein
MFLGLAPPRPPVSVINILTEFPCHAVPPAEGARDASRSVHKTQTHCCCWARRPLTGQETAATSASGGVSWPVGRVGRLFRVLLVPLIDECDTMIH